MFSIFFLETKVNIEQLIIITTKLNNLHILATYHLSMDSKRKINKIFLIYFLKENTSHQIRFTLEQFDVYQHVSSTERKTFQS